MTSCQNDVGSLRGISFVRRRLIICSMPSAITFVSLHREIGSLSFQLRSGAGGEGSISAG